MRTEFSNAQRAKPALAEVEKSLRACVHCGICTATCPSYLLTGDERDGPRGRIVMMQKMLESDAAPASETVHHLDRCLTCLGCRTACPSGVDYQRLIGTARAHIAGTFKRPYAEQLLRRFIAEVLTRPAAVRSGFTLARWFAPLATRLPGRLGEFAMKGAKALPPQEPLPPADPALKPIALLPGCVQAAMAPQIDAAAARVLARRGYGLVPLVQAGCCGALSYHLGEDKAARRWAMSAIGAFEAAGGAAHFSAVLITATGCGAHLADYGHLFAEDAAWSARAQGFAGKVRDLSQLVEPGNLRALRPLRVALQKPCSLQHGLRLDDGGGAQLRAAGHEVIEIAEGHLCCGSAGSFAILQPELAGRLRTRKLGHANAARPDVIASANIGCIEHLSGGTPVVHWIELLDWAEGGPMPGALSPTRMAR